MGRDPKQQLYYERKVARGRDDYYSGRSETPGRWAGGAARELGLSGELEAGQLKALMDGRHPGTGELLALRGGRSTTVAFDLTFSAPKSVSVLFALGDPHLSRTLADVHEEAVEAALGYLEGEACRVRRGHNGTRAEREKGLARGWERVRPEPAAGFLTAAYRHRMSRGQDPHLHTHVVCANMACGADGRWTALDGSAIYEHAKAAGYLYQAHLRAAVRERVAWAEWGQVSNGMAELLQVPEGVLSEFSQRRRRILEREAELAAAGIQVGHAGRERIAYDTREPKQEIDERDWRAQIRTRAAEHGLGRDELAALAELPASAEPQPMPEPELAAVLFSPAGLTAERNVFHDRDVVAAVAQAATQGAPVSDLLPLAERMLAHPEVVQVAPGLDPRFTTAELLAAERGIVEQAEQGRGQGAGVLEDRHTEIVLYSLERPLSGEQDRTVRAIVTSGNWVDTVEALAGTGKTTCAGALRELYGQAGYRVIGAAPTGRAVRELKERAGITDSLTLDGWAVKLAADPHTLRFAEITEAGVHPQPAVMIIDEAGLAHTRLSARVIDQALDAGVKVVAVGDSGQLSSVRAGGWLGALTRRVGSHELREVMRQRDPAERRHLAHLHRGDPTPYLQLKTARQELRLHAGEQPGTDAERAVLREWAHAREQHGATEAVMICRDNQRRERLNQLARARLKEQGELGEAVEIGGWEWGVGDRVIARRNDRARDLDNGMRATITTIDTDHQRLIVEVDSGGTRQLDREYVERHLEHAYALTGHGMQGGTVEWAAVVGQPEDFSRNWSYTALSRARQPTRIHLIDEPTRLQEDRGEVAPAPSEKQPDPLERLAHRMRQRDDEDLALEQLQHAHRAEAPETRQLPAPLARLEQLDRELSAIHAQLADPSIEQAGRIATLSETIAAVRAEQQRDGKPTGLRDRTAHRTRQHERRQHLERLHDQRDRLLQNTPDPDAVLAHAEHLRRTRREIATERHALREQTIDQELAARPPWLTHTLGPEPADPHLRERWQHAAREIAGHRLDHHITDPATATPQPDASLQRSITDTRAALGLDQTERERDAGREI